ncbi:MAG TPA: peptidoglycan-binding protein [Ensifer sp.]|nr:peptidoglycan-binding protein [Ensifer sp.]
MNTRKRRPPKRQAGRVSRMIAGGAAMIGAAAMRNPVATGGTAAFAIVFSFVAANALWYQPSSHPHPWLDTRDAFRDYASKAMHPGSDTATTYRVERDATAPADATAAAPKPVDGVVVHDDPAPAANPLVADIQSNLVRRGLYDGPVDGVMGQKTEAAIMFYQETRGLPQTGAADAAVLDLLKKDNSEFNVVPPDRPADVTGAIAAKATQKPVEKVAPKATDPVAALIAKAPRPQAPKPQADMTKSESVKAARPAVAPPIPPAPIPNATAKVQADRQARKPVEKPAQKPVQKAVKKQDDKSAQNIVATGQRPVAIPAKADAQARPAPSAAPSNLTMAIQKGLSNLAYRDVTIDGVPGEQTKEAIRHFQKHYRLPVTGEPNEAVLEKLKKIGAL